MEKNEDLNLPEHCLEIIFQFLDKNIQTCKIQMLKRIFYERIVPLAMIQIDLKYPAYRFDSRII